MLDAQKVIYDLESLFSVREVNSRDVYDTLELALGVIFEEGQDGNNRGWRDMKRELILQHGELLNKLWQALREVGAICMQ